MYISHLVEHLDIHSPSWREDSVILLDGSRVHVSDDSKDFIKKLGIPVIFTGPYAYDGAPIEMFFSYFKSASLASLHLATGKR